jgi:hypothetical protein
VPQLSRLGGQGIGWLIGFYAAEREITETKWVWGIVTNQF